MTKLISILGVLVLGFIGYALFNYWQSVSQEEDQKKPAAPLTEDQLPGLPYGLQQSYAKVKDQPAALGEWLKNYGNAVQDPRKAAIQLDYCLLITRENIGEAKRIFAEVKARTPKSSPVWPRIQQLEKTYQ